MAMKPELQQFHRDAIAAAAGRLFAGKGFFHTTIDDVAHTAGYSKATLYVYFRSKHEMFYYNALRGAQKLHSEFQQVLTQPASVPYKCRQMCLKLYGFCSNYPYYFQSLLGPLPTEEGHHGQSLTLDEIYQVGRAINDDFASLFQQGMDEGVFRAGINPLEAGLAFWASLCGLILFSHHKESYLHSRIGKKKEVFVRDACDAFLRAAMQ